MYINMAIQVDVKASVTVKGEIKKEEYGKYFREMPDYGGYAPTIDMSDIIKDIPVGDYRMTVIFEKI